MPEDRQALIDKRHNLMADTRRWMNRDANLVRAAADKVNALLEDEKRMMEPVHEMELLRQAVIASMVSTAVYNSATRRCQDAYEMKPTDV